MKNNPTSRLKEIQAARSLAIFVLASLAHQGGFAQTARSPLDAEVIELSPFVVSSDNDTGYAANETLAGTRMRTSLRDVGAPLTVLTPEFLSDLAVTSYDQALLYTPSVNSLEGDNGDNANGTALRYGSGQSYSIRGFSTSTGIQSVSHDFFSALEPTDSYNLERITLSLGPNSMLIGVGNPQGVAVTTTKRAQLNRQKTTIQGQVDRWSSRRVSIDHNQPLIRDRLALRLNLLHDEKREFRKYEGKNQERMTIGITYKPLANTKITASHESYSLHLNVGSLMQGFNGGMLRWIAAGKPTVDFLPAGQTWTSTRAYVDASGNRIPVAPGVVDADGFVDAQTDFDPNRALGVNSGNTPTWIVGLNLPNPMVNTRYQGQLQTASFGGISSASYQSMDPWSLVGIDRDTFMNGGTRDDPAQKIHGRWTQLFVEQKIADNLYLELAGSVARHNRRLDTSNFTVIQIDPNRYLPDGSLNPGYLVPYVEGPGQRRPSLDESREYRATLSYELDLTKRNRWLGRHNFAGLYQFSRSDAAQDITRAYNLATIGLPSSGGWSNDALNSANYLRTRAYFVNGQVPVLPDLGQVMKNKDTLNGYGRMVGATANEAAAIDLDFYGFSNPSKTRFEDEALSFGWQGRWFKERLVTVMGYRVDDTKSYTIPNPSRNTVLPGVAGSATDPLKQVFTPAAEIPLNSEPTVAAKGITRTYGAVYHALPWLSLTYSKSSNFLPVANASWVNSLGEPSPNAKGRTEDYGLRFYLLQNKLSISLNRFETGADDQARNANGYVSGARNILTRLRTNYKNAGDSHFANLAEVNFYPIDTGNVADTWSYVAEGYEMTLTYNPSPRWRMALSGSINKNQLSTHLAALGRYLYMDSEYQGLGTWKKYASELRKVEAGQPSASFDLNPNSSADRTKAAADALYIEQQVAAQEKRYQDEVALDGITTSRDGKYALNGLITRVFTEGRLKGWSVGGNFRWRSANTLGYERLPDAQGLPNGLLDVAHPLMGKQYWDVGAMVSWQRRISKAVNLRIQLNVQNLPNWREARLVKMDSDTMGLYGDTSAYVPVLWEMRRPRNFILTTTFDF